MLCPREIIFNGINIASRKETLDEIINSHKSLARFGDGEFKIIFGIGLDFQEKSKLLKAKLLNVLNSGFNNLLIGINMRYHEHELNLRPGFWGKYWKNFIHKYKFKIIKLLNVKRKYYFISFCHEFFFYLEKDPKINYGSNNLIKFYYIYIYLLLF